MKVYGHWNGGRIKHHGINPFYTTHKPELSGNWSKPEWCMGGDNTGETVVEDEEGIKIRIRLTHPTRSQDGHHNYW